MRHLYKLFGSGLILCFIVLTGNSFAQINDAGLWTSVTIEKRIIPKLSVSLSEELRFNENISELGTAFTEIGADYRIIKYISAGLRYRYIQRRRVDDFYSIRHRYMIDLAFRYKIKKTGITLRERYQTQYADVYIDENGKIPERYLRSKLTLKYDFEKKYIPFISAELFYQLSNPVGNELDNVRYTAGFDYEINKRMTVELSYLVNKEFNVSDPVTDYVTGVGFAYSF